MTREHARAGRSPSVYRVRSSVTRDAMTTRPIPGVHRIVALARTHLIHS